ncbi:acyl carrier protein [Pseudohalioglobus lutimaris]|uniref:Acyl carrier protein n=1 Tax=Pseudohalioglobus lutimaris TaxID=1737061 RepID=A0A2N5WZI2_9GAMM|nr:acyl carrier protein [Pseudohalioglobus lutimaris]PLW67654.1 acyl carrier protein [Pseudohalioglobus lutimaris]
MNSREEILEVLRELLVDMFEVEAAEIRPDVLLYEDLDVDSIDAVDLVVELRKITGKQINPDEFKAVRTVDDVVNAVSSIVGIE